MTDAGDISSFPQFKAIQGKLSLKAITYVVSFIYAYAILGIQLTINAKKKYAYLV